MNHPTGYLLYSGPSELDGAPIVAIATLESSNGKTGNMIQTWIMRADVNPLAALTRGLDSSVCGNCPLRGNGHGSERACYVELGHAPLAVWRAYTRERYPVPADIAAIGEGRAVRLGSYGDPAAVPVAVWAALVSRATLYTGYTHQWANAPELRPLVMASADTAEDKATAWEAGWRTFRIANTPETGEIECPSERGVQCIDCGLCDGAGRAKSITIPAHGAGAGYVN